MPDTSTPPLNHNYDKDTGTFTPRGGATPDGGNPSQDSFKSKHPAPPAGLIGNGMAKKAADAIVQRPQKVMDAADDMS